MAKDKLLLSAVGLGAVVLLAALFLPDWRTEPPTASEPAPDFHFTWNGQTQRLSELRGQVVVLNFWATWCPPCVDEMPSLERLYRKLSERGVVVLGVSVDTDAAAYERFLRENHITFPNYRDPKGEIARRYGTWMFPETYIINRDGRVDRKIVGPHEWDNPEILFYLAQLAGS
ncbi:MAG: TlpA family protein disulfide reductase [Acidobacteria bacterium]|nr:TlpA family protein disulfide reductase [Acidobacteriota bacterium]